jgi:hypothetical protein
MFCQVFVADVKSEIFIETRIRQTLQYQELEAKWHLQKEILDRLVGWWWRACYVAVRMRLSNTAFCVVQCVEVHRTNSRLDFMGPNLGSVSEKYGEHFHRDIEATEERNHGGWDTAVIRYHILISVVL